MKELGSDKFEQGFPCKPSLAYPLTGRVIRALSIPTPRISG
jgi:hypothetical protein